MSFGFSLGDFITAIQLANKLRKDFVDAPSQFKAIHDEVRSLWIVLSDRELGNEQEADLKQIAHGCRNVLKELENTLDQYCELKSGHRSVSERVKRVWKRLKWEPKDIEQLRSRISTNIGLLNAFTSRLNRDDVVTLVQNHEDQGRQNILDWITPIDYALQQSDFINRRQAGTGQWLLDSTRFKAWVETNERTLFCPGIPGAGKTILTSIVIGELFAGFENDGDVGIAYIYCNYRRQYEQKPEDLFASLLKQLVQEQPSIPDSVRTLYNRHKDTRTRPSLDEIIGVLQTVAAAYSRIFIIADALDECQVSDGCRQRFLSSLFNLQGKCGANLFATSRPLSSIEREFEGTSKLEIRASEEDVRRYLDGNLFRLPGFVARSLELQEEIKTALINAVNGMHVVCFEHSVNNANSTRFLLAQLHLESLTGKRSPKAIRVALKNFATGSGAYDHAYKDCMERINGQVKDQEELAKQVLSWITCANRPLTTTELQHALGVEVGESKLDEENLPDAEDIVSACAGLVTIDEESEIIRLVHYTTQEYFERTQKQWFPDAHNNITTICVTYLSFDEFENGICPSDEEFEQRLQLNKLYNYAAHNWGHHARAASTTCQGVIEFLQKQGQVEASSQVLIALRDWSRMKIYSLEIPMQMTGLHLAAYFGVDDAVQFLLSCYSPIMKDSYNQTPLHWASCNGHLEVAQLLLNKGADVKATESNCGWTSLYYASRFCHLEVVQLLLDKGADVNAADSNGRTPLYEASYNGDLKLAQLLLNKGANIKAKDNVSRTPLLYAARNGNKAIVELLLATNRGDVDSGDYYNSTPLSVATRMGHKDIVALLLTKSHAFNVQDSFGQTPLWWARRNGYPEIAELLLQKCKDEGIIVQEDDLPTATISVPSDDSLRYCDICVLYISERDTLYHCSVCNHGEFDICEEGPLSR